MSISVLGIDHQYSAEIREMVAFTESQIIEFSSMLLEMNVEEVVILSTCNRSEVYFSSKNADVSQKVKEAYIRYFSIEEQKDCVFLLHDDDAIHHIFRVTSGIESAIIGEDEILRQIKEAYEFSLRFKNTGKRFNRLFQEAIRCAKEVKSKLKISEIPISTGYIGLKYLEEQVGTFEGKHMMLIGFGEIGQLFYQYGKELPFRRITVCNRSRETADAILDGQKRDLYIHHDQWKDVINDVDILITATSCPHHILKAEEMMVREKPIYMLDMAIPRNIDNQIGMLNNYHLYNIDVLKEMSAQNAASRLALRDHAEEIIENYVSDYKRWLDHSEEDNVIESLNQSVDDILDYHLKYLFQRIKANEREQKIITRTMQAALKKAVRNPIIALKNIDDPQKRAHYSEVLEELFQLDKGEPK
ncbi:MAG TPA: glutamyl-tRNA reductase [Firmicutes bacterium]|nr:glutamyl-tRNA reductase [Bacillota bacterium]